MVLSSFFFFFHFEISIGVSSDNFKAILRLFLETIQYQLHIVIPNFTAHLSNLR